MLLYDIYIGLYRQWILYNGLFGYIYIYTSLDRSKLWPVLLGTGAPPHRFLEKEQMFTASDVQPRALSARLSEQKAVDDELHLFFIVHPNHPLDID